MSILLRFFFSDNHLCTYCILSPKDDLVDVIAPIEYVTLQHWHLRQLHDLLSRIFWPGIDGLWHFYLMRWLLMFIDSLGFSPVLARKMYNNCQIQVAGGRGSYIKLTWRDIPNVSCCSSGMGVCKYCKVSIKRIGIAQFYLPFMPTVQCYIS